MSKDEIKKALDQKREQLNAYTYDPQLHSKQGLTLRYDVFRAYVAFFSFLKWGYMTPIFLVSLTSEHWEKLLLKADYDTTDDVLSEDMGFKQGMQYYVAQRFSYFPRFCFLSNVCHMHECCGAAACEIF